MNCLHIKQSKLSFYISIKLNHFSHLPPISLQKRIHQQSKDDLIDTIFYSMSYDKFETTARMFDDMFDAFKNISLSLSKIFVEDLSLLTQKLYPTAFAK